MELLVFGLLATVVVDQQPNNTTAVSQPESQNPIDDPDAWNDLGKCGRSGGSANADKSVGRPLTLPPPEQEPLSIDFFADPIIGYTKHTTPMSVFCALIRAAILDHPSLGEAQAGRLEAIAGKKEARSALFPTIDVSISNRTSILRNFGNNTDNLVERARARGRTDSTFNLQQRIFDFGAASNRASAAGVRIEAARYEVERQADEIALSAIGIWYDVFAYRALTQISSNMSQQNIELRANIDMRIAMGASARGDRSRVDAHIASHNARHEVFERQLAESEARFLDFFGARPRPDFARIGGEQTQFPNEDGVRALALQNPVVKLVQAQARGARLEAKASRADTLPRVNAGLEGGRFGIFDSNNDYDVRGTLSLTHRFFGNSEARADQASARADAALARAKRLEKEAATQAAVALNNLKALKRQRVETEKGYIAQRQSRDVLFERFRLTRGTLFDVMESDRALVDAAISHIQVTSEQDVARFTLLSRIGKLLDEFGIDRRRLMDAQ